MFFSLRAILISGINQGTLIISINKTLIYPASEIKEDDERVEDGECLSLAFPDIYFKKLG